MSMIALIMPPPKRPRLRRIDELLRMAGLQMNLLAAKYRRYKKKAVLTDDL